MSHCGGPLSRKLTWFYTRSHWIFIRLCMLVQDGEIAWCLGEEDSRYRVNIGTGNWYTSCSIIVNAFPIWNYTKPIYIKIGIYTNYTRISNYIPIINRVILFDKRCKIRNIFHSLPNKDDFEMGSSFFLFDFFSICRPIFHDCFAGCNFLTD